MDRRSFVVAGLFVSVPPALALCGCSFSLRSFLHASTRIPDIGEDLSDERAAKGSDASELDASPVVPEAVGEAQYGFWMDSASCVGCASCVEACRSGNGIRGEAPSRRTVRRYAFDDGSVRSVSLSCMHCAKPACAEVCPAGAVEKRIDGIVTVDRGRCIGCRYCRQACPFGIPRYTQEGMDKCDCCLGAGVRAGATPYCVSACPTRSLQYGELDQLRRREGCPDKTLEAPTDPSFFLS